MVYRGSRLSPAKLKEREQKVNQLKAYLLFFEQHLANYLAQLSNTRDFFSLKYDLNQTYFTEFLTNSDIPGIEQLFHLPPYEREIITHDYTKELKHLDEDVKHIEQQRIDEYNTSIPEVTRKYDDFLDRRNAYAGSSSGPL